MLFNEFHSRIRVEGKITAMKPIHIGTGEDSTNPAQVDAAVLKDSEGRAIIPGSSLKGVLRSRIEGILSSGIDGWRSCNILSKDSCTQQAAQIKEAFKEKEKVLKNQKTKVDERDADRKFRRLLQEEYIECCKEIYENSCDVCRMFGNGKLAGRVSICDMYTKDKINTERRDGVGINRDSGTAQRGAKYSFEIVPAGTEFDFLMIAENLDEKQKMLLEIILQMLKEEDISVGGIISRGLGQIKLSAITRTEINRDNIADHYGLGKKEASNV
ncbi:CRISPR-associated Csx7 family protein [Anaerobacterium chartisolvens]|uniref:CRISPR-associated Csx7 family protein n=1 Tax=Anaerobacterium chartisolvens TaxID=1297424 RepID=A0A369AVT7_9FIRM|nr:CRISPR-associated RAMP protein Csx7 [Anaerobacterium chartisolvens]RCX13510.1 CRISPR-associated Csx7 family protein [Anaerobacterium chartisolvens]